MGEAGKQYAALFLGACFLVLPSTASAQVVISEIMYDLDGADSGREWIEVYNTSGSSVQLSSWRLLEADTNHKMSAIQGGESLAPGAYAVVADNAVKFMEDNPGYSGQLFDSAFSLSNAGETLALRDTDLIDRDTISYVPEWGAAGDGNSLQRTTISGSSFSAAVPTPGSGSLGANTAAGTDSPAALTAQGSGGAASAPAAVSASTPSGTVRVEAGNDMVVVAGADVHLTGSTTRGGVPLTGANFVWNFGDGAIFMGREAVHSWRHTGKFVVTLEASVDGAAAHDSFIVTVKPLALTVTVSDSGNIVLANTGVFPVDLSGWKLAMGGGEFVIPKHTQLLAGSSIEFDIAVTRLNHVEYPARVYYPSGALAAEESMPKIDTAPEQGALAAESTAAPKRNIVPAGLIVGRVVVPEPQLETPEPHEPTDTEVWATTSHAVATAATAPIGWPWYLSLLGITGLGAFAAVTARRHNREQWQIEDMEESG